MSYISYQNFNYVNAQYFYFIQCEILYNFFNVSYICVYELFSCIESIFQKCFTFL